MLSRPVLLQMQISNTKHLRLAYWFSNIVVIWLWKKKINPISWKEVEFSSLEQTITPVAMFITFCMTRIEGFLFLWLLLVNSRGSLPFPSSQLSVFLQSNEKCKSSMKNNSRKSVTRKCIVLQIFLIFLPGPWVNIILWIEWKLF